MALDNIKFEFSNSFSGIMHTPRTQVAIGSGANEVAPYHLLFGALASCFYATFLSITIKKRLEFSRAEIEVSGTQRKEVPTILENVIIQLKIFNPSDEQQFLRSAELGAQYCSIHETISQTAKIDLEVEFINE